MWYRAALIIVLLLIPFTAQAQTATPSPNVEQAQKIVQMLVSGDFTGVYDQFDATVKGVVTAAQLEQAWQSIINQVGAYGAITNTREDAASHQVIVTIQFDKAVLDAHIVFDSDGKIGGLTFTPAAPSGTPTPTPVFATPTYVPPNSFTETAVTVGDLKLPGLLTLPSSASGAGPFPAVVLIAGSGPEDHDETIGPNKPLRDIAWGLAAQGVASLRYDKRTFAARASLDIKTLTINDEYVTDAVAAVEQLRQTGSIDPARVFILGHSQGGYAAPRIAKADPHIAGVILLAAEALPLPEKILAQTQYIASLGTQTPDQQQSITAVQKLVDQINALTPDSPSDTILLGAAPAYWLDMRGYDPAALEASLPQPVLVLQGESDYQVTLADDFPVWQKALADHPDVTFKTYPGLNHIFMHGAGTGMSTPDDYSIAGNVAQAPIDNIAAWVKAH